MECVIVIGWVDYMFCWYGWNSVLFVVGVNFCFFFFVCDDVSFDVLCKFCCIVVCV